MRLIYYEVVATLHKSLQRSTVQSVHVRSTARRRNILYEVQYSTIVQNVWEMGFELRHHNSCTNGHFR